MTLGELQSWIASQDGLLPDLRALSRYAAAKCVDIDSLELAPDLKGLAPNWSKLLLAASILASSDSSKLIELALGVAHAGLLFSDSHKVEDASGVLLTQLSNHRALHLANFRKLLSPDLEGRAGVGERLAMARRELLQTIFLKDGNSITANRFQRQFWDDLNSSAWVSASAPTAAGKTFLVLQWLINELASSRLVLAVFIAPTRALVGEVEREISELAISRGFELRVASLPVPELGDRSKPSVLVLTQERLHVFLNSAASMPKIDIILVDEAHKIGDGLRGVILQDAIERVLRGNPHARAVMLSPLTDNPELLVDDAPPGVDAAVTPSDLPTVSQHVFFVEQKPRDSRKWSVSLRQGEQKSLVGELTLHAQPDSQRKRLSYVALAWGKNQGGTLVYANGADEAEKLSWQIFHGLGKEADIQESDSELKDLADFARDTVHPRFQLVELLSRRVAFHYGNMPTLLRSEIERLFKKGTIKFLICTSTLVEGVNLACRTIVMRGPRKGNNKPMQAHDFWNLAGRAGRWGQDFHGNIVCVDTTRSNLWPNGVPHKTRYPIVRETDAVIQRSDALLPYLRSRPNLETRDIDAELEQVTAYLLAWYARMGSFLNAPAAKRLDKVYAAEIDATLAQVLAPIDVPVEIISRHPGVSAVALHSLLKYFRQRRKNVEELIPSLPTSDDAYDQFIAVFGRINRYLYPAFYPPAAAPAFSVVTVEWMRGLPLARIISNRIDYLEREKKRYTLPSVIRSTMRNVEDVARFKAPKYLSAYVDVLRQHLKEIGREDLLSNSFSFDLFLEFGVSTTTLLSLIGIGLSRTSAVAVNEYLGSDDLSEEEVVGWLREGRWQNYNLSNVVKREIDQLVLRRTLAPS